MILSRCCQPHYLENRTQVVKVEASVSAKQSIKSGVPQGSILGPLLFLLYINDLTLTVAHSAIDLYADDSSLYKTGKHIQDVQINIQHNVDQVAKWCKKNSMSLNSDKTKSMVICNKSRLSIVEDSEIKVIL